MFIRALLCAALATVSLAVVRPAAADVPEWAHVDASVGLSPASVLATAPAGQPLVVEVTTQTSDGPKVESVVAGSRREALTVIDGAQDNPDVLSVGMAHKMSIASKDPMRPYQWGDTRLRAESSWKYATGKGVVVAVVDTGVSRSHPDLKGQLLQGWDFVRGTAGGGYDPNGHGTHVAGIIGAVANNKIGGTGLAPQADILPVRVLGEDGSGYTDVIAQGILYAVERHAKVINLSISGPDYDPAIEQAVAYARYKGALVVAAAGNDGCVNGVSPVSYPAAYEGVVGVAAVNADNSLADFSDCGSWIDIAAPGGVSFKVPGIGSTVPGVSTECGVTNGYCFLQGTSMAAAFVTAAAAMVLESKKKHGDKIAWALYDKADDIGPPGFDIYSGHGMLDVIHAVAR